MQDGFAGGLRVGVAQRVQREFALPRAAAAPVEPGVGQRGIPAELGEGGQRDAQGVLQGFSLVHSVSGAAGGVLRIRACMEIRARS
ncbi:hypothetical protein D9M68_925400 [compost metagenome]